MNKNRSLIRKFFRKLLTVIFFSGIPFLFSSSGVYAQGYWTKPEEWKVEELPFTKNNNSNWLFDAGAHLRLSYNHVRNTVDLNSGDNNDKTSYLGAAYDFTFDVKHLSGSEVYLFIERRGRADYDAPITGTRSIDSLFGRYHWYHDSDLTPRLREYYVDIPLTPSQDVHYKLGLYPYAREVGHGIALGGKYENYGSTISGFTEPFDWNLHWEKEDLNNRIHLGKVIDHEKGNRFNDTEAYFSAGDITFKIWEHEWQFYLGWLHDRTTPRARSNLFNNTVRREDLVTPGQYLQLKLDKVNLGFEAARNMGEAKGLDGTRDIKHQGYLLVGDASYDLGSFKPKTKLVVASGNKFDETNYNEISLSSDKNKAFSVFSPLNTNLTDTHYQKQFGPYVAMAGGYAVNFGVARPGTFSDPFLFENIIAATLGFDYTPYDKIYLGMDYWHLRSKEAGYGLGANGNPQRFSKDLGHEIDLFASYQVTPSMKISLLTGYFFPGDYYKEVRTDTSATNVFAPTPRRDGNASPAFQVELGFDFTY
jgi:hypothetical protein